MRKAVVLPAVALAGGLLSLGARVYQRQTAFEPGTGLPIPGAMGTYVLGGVVILALAALALLSRGSQRTFEKCYTSAFRPTHLAQLSAVMAGAVLLGLAGLCCLESFVSATADPYTGLRSVGPIRLVLGVVCLAAAAGIWFTVQSMKNRQQANSIWLLMPGLAACFWVMSDYQTWATDPVMANWALPLLGVLVSMLAGCFLPGFAFGKGRVSLTLFLCLAGAVLCLAVLGDGLPLYDVALYMGMVFYLLGMASSLADNDAKPEPPVPVVGCGGSCQGCTGCGPAPAPTVSEAELTEMVKSAPKEEPKAEYVIKLPDNEI